MHSLASFDRWFVQAARRPATPSTPAAAPASYLIGPQRDTAQPVNRASAADILRAAYRIEAADWCGLLSDDAARGRGGQPTWRLALWRAQRPGQKVQAHADHDAGPQWLSEALAARPGQRPGELLAAVQRAALQTLWAQGWRLVEAAQQPGHAKG